VPIPHAEKSRRSAPPPGCLSKSHGSDVIRGTSKHLLLVTVAVCTPVVTNAAGQSYMSLVGELVGAVESPRVLRDICARSVPETAAQNARAYEAWAKRNDEILVAVQAQRSRADVRLARQTASQPGTPKSTEEFLALLQEQLVTQLRQAGPKAAKNMCSKYPELISSSEEARAIEIRSLLKSVTHADEVLTQREAQQ
jgi:hypothetical protein